MKYRPLTEYLQALPAGKAGVSLTFAEIERIIGAKLPHSAYNYAPWWANQEHGPQGTAWLGAGFIARDLNLGREMLTFARRDGPPTKTRTKQQKRKRAPSASKLISAETLLKAGFEQIGHWERKGEAIALVGDIPADPGVYAHIVDGKVYYIGSATMGLKKRLYFYGKPGKTQTTSIRINGLIKDELSKGNTVTLIAAIPGKSKWNGLPVDNVTGLETGLIKTHCPPWNKRGVAG